MTESLWHLAGSVGFLGVVALCVAVSRPQDRGLWWWAVGLLGTTAAVVAVGAA